MSAHHEKIGPPLLCFIQNDVRDCAAAAFERGSFHPDLTLTGNGPSNLATATLLLSKRLFLLRTARKTVQTTPYNYILRFHNNVQVFCYKAYGFIERNGEENISWHLGPV